MNISRKEVGGIALLVGTVIGAGIFGIPYATQQFGFWPGMGLLFILAVVTGIATMAYADLVLNTRAKTQFAGVIGEHLGPAGYFIAFITLVSAAYGALLAYTVEIGNLLTNLMAPWLVLEPVVFSLLFYAVASMMISFGLKSVMKMEVVFVALVIFIIFLFGFISVPLIEIDHLSGFNPSMWWLPYGVMLFALPGLSAMPDVVRLTGRDKASVRKVVLIGIILPALLYGLFTLAVVGVSGPDTTQSAIVGFGQAVGPIVLRIGALLGILTMGTSFLVSGLVSSELFEFDAKTGKLGAFFLAMAPPLIIFLMGQPSFINVISTVGSLVMGMLGILILLAWRKLRQHKPNKRLLLRVSDPVVWGIVLFFVFGFGYQIFTLVT